MKKEWLLFVICGSVTLVIALLLIRWIAPGLLGVPVDLQMVQIKKEVPPFFDGVFRDKDLESNEFLLHDPLSKVRANPLLKIQNNSGPHDLLGFRNKYVPNTADLIVIGDSQTYGVNVPLEFNWPSQAKKNLKYKQVSLYNMSVGGWGGIQYFYIFKHALKLSPRAIVVAFYTGNDSLESVSLAYGSDIWKEFRVDPSLDQSDIPKAKFPPPEEDFWPVTFNDGIQTFFTPKYRLTSNLDHPAVKTGYEILAKVVEKIASQVKPFNLPVVFTIIPTKELVYANKVESENISPPKEYIELVTHEKKYIDQLREKISSFPNVKYADVLTPLQERAMFPTKLYPPNEDGHPSSEGYLVIGNTIAKHVYSFFPPPLEGLVFKELAEGHKPQLYYVTNRQYWIFSSPKIAAGNGWDLKRKYAMISDRDIAGYEYMGQVNIMNPDKFGPNGVQGYSQR